MARNLSTVMLTCIRVYWQRCRAGPATEQMLAKLRLRLNKKPLRQKPMELTQLATTDQKKSLEVRQMSEAGPSPQRTQTADSTMSMVVEKKRVSIQLDSMPRPRPANITTVNKGSGSLSNLSSAEEDLLEGGQSISPAGQTISSRPASPIRSRQSDDVQARQPAAANFGVNNEEMYDMRVESADLDFVVPRSFFCTLD